MKRVWRHRVSEVGIEFEGGIRHFVHRSVEGVELSITGCDAPEEPGAQTDPCER